MDREDAARRALGDIEQHEAPAAAGHQAPLWLRLLNNDGAPAALILACLAAGTVVLWWHK